MWAGEGELFILSISVSRQKVGAGLRVTDTQLAEYLASSESSVLHKTGLVRVREMAQWLGALALQESGSTHFSPSTLEAGTGGSLSSRPAWSTE